LTFTNVCTIISISIKHNEIKALKEMEYSMTNAENVTEKICTGCNQVKPLEDFHKDKNGKYGRVAQCKDCVANKHGTKTRRDMRVPREGYKFCSKCKEEKVRSEFIPDVRASDGLSSQCRTCNASYSVKNPGKHAHLKEIPHEPEGMRYCPVCNQMKDIEEFTLYKQGKFRRRECKDCKRAAARKYASEHKKEAKAYREANREKSIEYGREYYATNRDKLVEQGREWRKNNPEKYKLSVKRAREQNPDKYRMLDRIRAARRRTSNRHIDFNFNDWHRCLEYFGFSCAVCGRKPDENVYLAADHYLPVKEGGLTVKKNMIPLCHTKSSAGAKSVSGCNNLKGGKLPDIWLRQQYSEEEAIEIEARIQLYFDSLSGSDTPNTPNTPNTLVTLSTDK
jgi:hypothetical protein